MRASSVQLCHLLALVGGCFWGGGYRLSQGAVRGNSWPIQDREVVGKVHKARSASLGYMVGKAGDTLGSVPGSPPDGGPAGAVGTSPSLTPTGSKWPSSGQQAQLLFPGI